MAQTFKMPRVMLQAALALAVSCLLLAAPARAEPVRLMILGSALTAPPGMPYEESYGAQLEKALQGKGHDVTIIDNGVADETTLQARARLDWILAEPVDGVILELGANDLAQNIAPDDIEFNLDAMLRALRTRKLPVFVIGARAPAAAPAQDAQAIEALFARLAVQYDTLFYPYALDGVTGNPRLMQDDGVHPNGAGVARIVAATLPAAEQLIANIQSAKASKGQ